VNSANNIWPRNVKDLVATFMALEILKRWIGLLQHRAHSAIGDYRARCQGLAE
jgi:hypothetical protein